ncbi:hypothetical protein OZX74_07635 [Bifidobacterium sp. ESL0798]|uniref:hypothetical protein n=1 Tax=Bifidobacterium sp. ESL0798 TaxID=2983235 RepID=UPI0023F657E2|nr:hypothetical protein [Bifidobacterium sp. ESL0798]WEV73757.1 hypothetical protein OZX74_07635 [Bifidobacterium sp. ESL0798]
MHRFGNKSEANGQIPVSGDDISYDDVSTPDTSPDTSTSFDSADYTQMPVGGSRAGKNAGGSSNKPRMKHGDPDAIDDQYGNKPVLSTANFVIALIAVVAVIIAAFVYFRGSDTDSGSNRTRDSYYSDSSKASRKLKDQQKKQAIVEEASNAYRAISDQDLKVTDALNTLTLNSGNSGASTEVTQEQVDELKSEIAKMSTPIDAFKKTQSYRKHSDVRKAYKEYTDKEKDYTNALNNFADSVIAYVKAEKSCNEANDWSTMNSDAATYANGKQKTITTCRTAAQGVADSKDGPIKQYAATTLKRMDDAQKQLDGIKGLGSADEIFGDETKFQSFEDKSRKLSDDLNPTKQFGNQNPIYKELTDARPSKAILKLNSAIFDADK